MNKQQVYLSGKISGLPDLNKPKFKAAAEMLTRRGLNVINPHDLPDDHHDKEWNSYMKECYKVMMDVECVIALDCWKKSRGARREVFVAEWLDMPVVRIEDFEPIKMPFWMKVGIILNIL